MFVIRFLDKCTEFLFADWSGGVVCGILLGIILCLMVQIFDSCIKSTRDMKKQDNDKSW